MKRSFHRNRSFKALTFERLEPRQLLASGPDLWLTHNNLGVAGGLPEDFVTMLERPDQWDTSSRAIDTLQVNFESLLLHRDVLNDEVWRESIIPTLLERQIDLAVSTSVATRLFMRDNGNPATRQQILQNHVGQLKHLVDLGAPIKHVSLLQVLSQPRDPGAPATWLSEDVPDRVTDVVDYMTALHTQLPTIDVGIIDHLPNDEKLTGLSRQWRSVYTDLISTLDNNHLELDHIHVALNANSIGLPEEDRLWTWTEFFDLQSFVQDSIDTEFGLLTGGGNGYSNGQEWREKLVEGIERLSSQLVVNGTPISSQPDRIIINSTNPEPATSIPEYWFDLQQQRSETQTAGAFDVAKILLESYGPDGSTELELRQVFPLSVTATVDVDRATVVGNARSVVDADSIRWNAMPWNKGSATEEFLTLQLPQAVQLNQVSLWFEGDNQPNTSDMLTSVYISESGLGNPLSHPEEWQRVHQSSRAASQAGRIDLPLSARWGTHVAVSHYGKPPLGNQRLGQSALLALRVYANSPNWPHLASPDIAAIPPSPLLWMQDNTLGERGRIPADFLTRFDDVASWEHTLRAIDTLSLNEHAMTLANGISDQFLREKMAPVLNRYQVSVSINTWAGNGLGLRRDQTGQSDEDLLTNHFTLIARLLNAGIRVRSVSMNTPLTRNMAGNMFGDDYSLQRRQEDVVRYSALIRANFPHVDVGIQDNLLTLKGDYENVYSWLADIAQPLDHIHYWQPVNEIGDDDPVDWAEIIQLQQFVQEQLRIEFGFMLNSSRGTSSAQNWRRDIVLRGAQTYLNELAVQGIARAPDRFIVTAWQSHPQQSTPENSYTTSQFGGQQRIESMTAAIHDLSALLRGPQNSNRQALIDEVQQVPPIAVWAQSNLAGAERIASGESLVDAHETIDDYRWSPDPVDWDVTSATYWIKFELPQAVNLDRIRLWPGKLDELRQNVFSVRIFASDNGTGTDFENDSQWQFVGEANVDGLSQPFETVSVNISQKKFIGFRLVYDNQKGPFSTIGLGAVRFYSPHDDWPQRPPSTPPTISWQRREVTWHDPGATIGKLLADGRDAAGRYLLSVDDERFTFYLSFLTLRAGIALHPEDAPEVTVNIRITDLQDPTYNYDFPFTFSVTSPFDGNGDRKDRYDYGDTSFYDLDVTPSTVARHLVGDLYLGSRVDAELSPQNDHHSRGDDLDIDGDDDDGVIFINEVTTSNFGGNGTILVYASQSGLLDGWIDFNGDRVFQHPEEHLFGGISQVISTLYRQYQFDVPSTATIGRTFARFRVSPSGSQRPYDPNPRGADVVGEVEDYAVSIVGVPISDQPPTVSWQSYPVISGVVGATAAKILADGYDADGRYYLTVDDIRFEFARAFLRLKPTIALDRSVETEVTVRITLIDKATNLPVTTVPVTIAVLPEGTELYDFGDAPYRYDTTAYENGPRHRLSPLMLGRYVDEEADGQNHFLAIGDDEDAQGDDDDGVSLLTNMVSADIPTIAAVAVYASQDGLLDAWIDFNGNGRFDHPLEHLSQNQSGPSIPLRQGLNTVSFVVPSTAVPGNTFARFRISSSGNLLSTGEATDGEVEDYRWTIEDASQTTTVMLNRATGFPMEEPQRNLTINSSASMLEIREGGSTIVSLPLPIAIQIHGSATDDIISLPSASSLTSNRVTFDVGQGFDSLTFQASSSFDTQQLLPGSIKGVDALDFSQGTSDHLFFDSQTLIDAIETGASIEVVVDVTDLLGFSSDWEIDSWLFREDGFVQTLRVGDFRLLLRDANQWTNPLNRFDVGRDNRVSAIDALQVINHLNRFNSSGNLGKLPPRDENNLHLGYLDVNVDGAVTPLDALAIINYLNRLPSTGEGEEGITSDKVTAGPLANSYWCFEVSNRWKLSDEELRLRQHPERFKLSAAKQTVKHESQLGSVLHRSRA